MRVDKIELYLVENRFHRPWRTAYGADPGNSALITCMRSGSHEGWSESSPLPGPTYSYEYGPGIFELAKRFLAPAVVGKEFDSARQLNQAMSVFKGSPFAKAGIEMAWWTLQADMQGVPLGKLLGAVTDKIDVGESFGIADSYDALIEEMGKSFDRGYKRVKLKMAHGWDYDMLAAVRSVFPNEVIHVDANSSYNWNCQEDRELLKSLDRFHLAMIEQPFQVGDLYYHAKLQACIDTPICLDESITEPWQAEEAAEMKACQYINVKTGRAGGLQNCLDINAICRQAGMGCWVGGMMESDVGKGICVELAAMDNMVYPSDITPETDNYPEPIGAHPLKYVAPWKLPVAQTPGTPIKPDMDKMLSKTRLHCSLKAEG